MHKSASSPYMKKPSSKPPSCSQSRLLSKKKHPVTMSTSRTESRHQSPMDSGSNNLEPRYSAARPAPLQKLLQTVGLAQQDVGLSVPSANVVLPPKIEASGWLRAKFRRVSIAWSLTTVSGFKSKIQSPRALAAAILLPIAKP